MVYCSPLRRARETARLAGFAKPTLQPLLVEWNYGDYEGLTSSQIREKRPDWELWQDGCPGGELPQTVLDRARRFLKVAFDQPDGPLLAFSHGHFIRALAIAFLELPPKAGSRLSLETTAVSVLRRQPGGALMQLWNDTGHLPGRAR